MKKKERVVPSRFLFLVSVCVWVGGPYCFLIVFFPCSKRFFNFPPYVKKIKTRKEPAKTHKRTRKNCKRNESLFPRFPFFPVSFPFCFFPFQNVLSTIISEVSGRYWVFLHSSCDRACGSKPTLFFTSKSLAYLAFDAASPFSSLAAPFRSR